MITVEPLPAFEGDCILVNLDGSFILIDSGTKETYALSLKDRLHELSNQKKVIDLAVLTHIDKDHIGGFLSLLSDKEANIQIREFWYNTFKPLSTPIESHVSRRGQRIIFSENRAVSDAMDLTKLLNNKKIPWNISFEDKVVEQTLYKSVMIGNANIWIVNPDKDKLQKMSKEWLRQTGNLRHANPQGEELFRISLEDDENKSYDELTKLKPEIISSPTNESSIAIIIEYEGKTLLFTGDASQKALIYALEEWCRINQRPQSFDLVKVPHHASYRSTNFEFYEKFKASNFIISTNGIKHNHPSVAVLAQIIKNNPGCNIVFNYKDNRGCKYYSNRKKIPPDIKYQILLDKVEL